MRRMLAVLPASLAVLVVMAPAPVAQPSGITRTEVGRGTVEDDYEVDGLGGTDVVVQTVTIEPGATSGWHTHPGGEIAIVKAGRLTFFAGDDTTCRPRVLGAGEVLVHEGRPHMGRNDGPEPVEIVVTYVDVPPGAPAASPTDEPAHCAGR